MTKAHGIMHQTIDGVPRRVKAVFLSCLDVMLLRVGPQVFPRSRILLGMALLMYLLSDTLVNWVQGFSAVPMVLDALFDAGYWSLAFVLVLGIWSVLPRLEQTLSAWFGVELLFNLVELPLAAASRVFNSPDAQAWLDLPIFLLILWSMAVMANLFHYALRANYVLSVIIAATAVTCNILLSFYLFPGL